MIINNSHFYLSEVNFTSLKRNGSRRKPAKAYGDSFEYSSEQKAYLQRLQMEYDACIKNRNLPNAFEVLVKMEQFHIKSSDPDDYNTTTVRIKKDEVLKDILQNYDDLEKWTGLKTYQLRPKKVYERYQAYNQASLGNALYRTDPEFAKECLLSAQKYFLQYEPDNIKRNKFIRYKLDYMTDPYYVEKEFMFFKNKILKDPTILSKDDFSKSVIFFTKEYLHTEKATEFREDLFNIAQYIGKSRDKEYSSIIYSHLLKITPTDAPEYEKYLINSYEFSKKGYDKIHELSRLYAMSNFYDGKNPTKKRTALLEIDAVLDKIIRNYDTTIENFQTIKRQPQSKESYIEKYAKNKIELAKISYPLDKRGSLACLDSAFEYFKNTDKKAIISYIKELQNRIKAYKPED